MRFAPKILDFLPVPFWVYFLSILASAVGLLPHQSPFYDSISRHALPVAIILMLIGTPLSDLTRMGRTAAIAMFIATVTIFFAQVLSYLLLIKFLPLDAWKSVGALMGTWIGGSANMVAVKEILGLSDGGLGPLVIVDTILSYVWMAFLLAAVRYQARFDVSLPESSEGRHPTFAPQTTWASVGQSGLPSVALAKDGATTLRGWVLVLLTGFLIGEISIIIGKALGIFFKFLSVNGWSLLVASTSALFLAFSPLKKLKSLGSTQVGTVLLYGVLVTIGARTNLQTSVQSPIFLLYGVVAFIIHGATALSLGRWFRVPLFLLSTSSQANIGGAVSAPLVAEAYRPGTAHIGVLMAVTGAVLGTYLGVLGGYLCRALGSALLGTPL